MQDRKFNVMLARFPGNNSEHPASSTWVIETAVKVFKDSRLLGPVIWSKSDTPITMVRNSCVLEAIKQKVDILVMIDSDMWPDHANLAEKSDAPFWDSSLEFFLHHYDRSPCMIAAPYCGPPPIENIYVFQWGTVASSDPDAGERFRLQQYTREQAAILGGIKEAAALPTGLVMMDMRIFTGYKDPQTGQDRKLLPPWFYYEWTDDVQHTKASTEDVTMTRDCSLMGIPVYCNWDAWACHMKLKAVGKPHLLQPKDITNAFRKVVDRSHNPIKATETIINSTVNQQLPADA